MNVEIWSDIICPFCYIGKRKFEKALDGFEAKDKVKIVWRSFQQPVGRAGSPIRVTSGKKLRVIEGPLN